MLKHLFEQQSRGKYCVKCQSMVSYAYWERHKKECIPTISEPSRKLFTPENDKDDDIIIIEETINTIHTKQLEQELRDEGIIQVDIKDEIDEIVLEEDFDEPPKKILKLYSTANDEKIVKTDRVVGAVEKTLTTIRSQIYATDPSEGLSLTEVYDLLMEQLEKLTKLGRGGGKYIVEQTKERLSQSPAKSVQSPRKMVMSPLLSDTSLAKDGKSPVKAMKLSSEQKDEIEKVDLADVQGFSAKNWEIPPDQLEDNQHHVRFSGRLCGYPRNLRSHPVKQNIEFSTLPSPEKKKKDPTQKDITFDEEDSVEIPRPKKLPGDVTILPYDPAEIEVLQSDSEYGASYVVRFFWNILYKVLSKETGVQCEDAISFWSENLRILYWLITMSDSEQHLFIRMCLRHRRWLTLEELQRYEKSSTKMIDIASNLCSAKLIESSMDSESTVTFDEILKKLSRDQLTKMARTYKIDPRHGIDTVISSLKQVSLGKSVFGQPLITSMMSNARHILGPSFRVNETPLDLFNMILTIFCPSTMDSINLFDPQTSNGLSSNLMFQLLQVETKKLNFCGPQTGTKCLQNFKSFHELWRYNEAKKIEILMAWSKGTNKQEEIYENGKKCLEKMDNLLRNEKDRLIELTKYPQHLRRYTDFWVIVRCCIHLIDACERLKKYDEAVEIIQKLLDDEFLRPFFPDTRGHLYDRLALDLDFHLKKKDEALLVCIKGLNDADVRNKDGLLLQDRANKLSSNFESVISLSDPVLHHIEGFILEKHLGSTKLNHFYVNTEKNDGEKEFISVEELVLRHFKKKSNFLNGLHCEGSVWHTIFGLICYDIVFDYNIPNVWISPIQDHPLDMNTREFFLKRIEKFEKRFDYVLTAPETEFSKFLKETFERNYGKTNAQVDWTCFTTFEQFYGILQCLEKEQLVKIMRRIAQDHRHNRSGFPDLTLWDCKTKRLALIEVKGPNDKLSTKQRLWLDYFQKIGIDASVCHVKELRTNYIFSKERQDYLKNVTFEFY